MEEIQVLPCEHDTVRAKSPGMPGQFPPGFLAGDVNQAGDAIVLNVSGVEPGVLVENSATGLDLRLPRGHDQHPCVSRWPTAC